VHRDIRRAPCGPLCGATSAALGRIDTRKNIAWPVKAFLGRRAAAASNRPERSYAQIQRQACGKRVASSRRQTSRAGAAWLRLRTGIAARGYAFLRRISLSVWHQTRLRAALQKLLATTARSFVHAHRTAAAALVAALRRIGVLKHPAWRVATRRKHLDGVTRKSFRRVAAYIGASSRSLVLTCASAAVNRWLKHRRMSGSFIWYVFRGAVAA